MPSKTRKPYYKDLDFLSKFGKHLREVRESKDFTQEKIALKCDFEISQISRIERGKTNPSISTVKKIASSLDIPFIELFSFLNER